jgi:hypothetical protein
MTELENLRLKNYSGQKWSGWDLLYAIQSEDTGLQSRRTRNQVINELLAILLVNYLCLSPLLMYCIVAIKERLNTVLKALSAMLKGTF